jgi:hypothetical protein
VAHVSSSLARVHSAVDGTVGHATVGFVGGVPFDVHENSYGMCMSCDNTVAQPRQGRRAQWFALISALHYKSTPTTAKVHLWGLVLTHSRA